jgi:ribosomal-protein-alanine N-acetyltransferase
MGLLLRYMNLSDVYAVSDIERRSFADAWSTQSFVYEIAESTYSYMVVLEEISAPPPPVVPDQTLLEQFINSLDNSAPDPAVMGYGGLWNIVDESHVSTIASHPDYRGKGYGELLFAAMVEKAIQLQSSYIVLEVRVSNSVAQQLYRKYGFTIADIRNRYYRDKEDAYDMRLDLENQATVENCQRLWQSIKDTLQVDDRYTTSPHPRKSL